MTISKGATVTPPTPHNNWTALCFSVLGGFAWSALVLATE